MGQRGGQRGVRAEAIERRPTPPAATPKARFALGTPTVRAVARALVVFILLVVPWPGLGGAFTDAVGAVATAIADPLTASSNVTFVLRSPVPEENQPEWRAVISVRRDSPDGPTVDQGAADLRRAGYLQLAVFAALAAGWPPRGWRRALLGLILSGGVVAGTIAVPVLAYLAGIGVLQAGDAVRMVLSLASRALVAAPGMAFAVPGLTWLAFVSGARPARGPDPKTTTRTGRSRSSSSSAAR
jgi:hypothetical protein